MRQAGVDEAACEEGLAARALIAKAVSCGEPAAIEFENKKLSVARDCFLRSYFDTVDAMSPSFLDLQIVSLIHREPQIDAAVRAHDEMIQYANSKYLGALALGFPSGAAIPVVGSISSNLDRSLYLQSLAMRDPASNKAFLDRVRNFIAECFARFGVPYPLRSFQELARLGRAFGTHWSPENFDKLPEFANELVAKSWYIWGAEFRLALLELTLDAKASGGELVEIYGLELLAGHVHILRAHANKAVQPIAVVEAYDDEDAGVDEDAPAGPDPYSALAQFSLQVKSRALRVNWCGLDNGYFDLARDLLAGLRRALSDNRLERAYQTLAYLHELDPSLLKLLDWEELHKRLPPFREVPSLAKCFSDVLFATHGASSTALHTARGDGIFIGSYSRVLEASRKAGRSRFSVVAQIRLSLPPGASQTFAQYLLRADIVADLHLKLPPPPRSEDGVEDELGRTEYLRAAQRIALAQQFIRQRVLDPALCSDLLEDERRCIALLRFRKALARGRIRVLRESLRGEAARFVELISPGLEFNRRYADHNNGRTAEVFTQLLRLDIDELIASTFLNGPNALDKQISGNIRHGWITDRYQASFMSAARACDTVPDRAFNWEDEVVVAILAGAYNELTELKANIGIEVEAFREETLTIKDNHPLLKDLRTTLRERLSKVITGKKYVFSDLVEEVRPALSDTVSALLDGMRGEFETLLVKKITDMIEACRERVVRVHGDRHTNFFDALTTAMNSTHAEIGSWLKVTEDDVEFGVFKASHLAMLEADIAHLSGSKNLNLEVECFEERGNVRRRVDDFDIKGGYFAGMAEIVHNLMSNALRHSGERYKTKISLRFIDANGDFVLECRNSFSKAALEKVYGDLERIIKLTSGESSELVGCEDSSGFQKIFDVCRHRMGMSPKIIFHTPKPGARNIMVEVRLPNATAKVKVA